MRIQTFDTTLRDGTQGEAVSFTVEDKLRIAIKLDELGIDYIEGGWPGSNPKDKEFFARAVNLPLRHAKLCAFGATRMAKLSVDTDPSVQELANAGTPAVSIFGKTWDLHVHRALGITLEENLVLIRETVDYLKRKGKEVIYDAEHFFDGYRANSGLCAPDARDGARCRCQRPVPLRHQRWSHAARGRRSHGSRTEPLSASADRHPRSQ